ncbi:heptaprenyl diphosphate synthase component 1 [Bacillus sp. FJAT-29814]|uniref:heptaprenyl diphosphate synthase component 1 n=1 Tax=Bacillus sp. FJAT-29814 TaxID=1729688 RepID=UPI0020A36E65|nr:heptaprenyl diphosphate synthase component 1 [Bacillus sp. FJAT-29814]
MRMQDIRQKFSTIKQKVEHSVFDTYLLNYIETPVIDEDKLLILISLLDRLDLPFDVMENYVLSTMLVQTALDTHEQISEITDEKSRQLTVLAGDYYSGLYYKLLAESEDILVINVLSQGIKEINEHKITVYYKETADLEKLMTSMMLIESSLITKLSEYFTTDHWNEVITNFLLFKRLVKEQSQFIQTGSSFLFDAMKKILFPSSEFTFTELTSGQKNQLLSICGLQIERTKSTIEKGISINPSLNPFLESKITGLLNQYQPYVKSFVEEG